MGFWGIFGIEKSASYFEALIDHFRSKDNTIGFGGDEGVARSGKIPRCLMSDDPYILAELSRCIIKHFEENDDHYFAIFDRSSNQPHVFYVGLDPMDNIFRMPRLPELVYGGFQTYGGISHSATRIALKAKFKI
jgi:hypothetical protein